MKHRFLFLFPVIVSAGIFMLSVGWQAGQKYDIDKTSPNGMYRVNIQLREEKGTGTREYTERLRIQYFRGQEIVYTHEAENSDQYEPSMLEGMRVVEWASDNVLRMGRERSDQPFSDEILISNNTDDYFKYLSISYGTFESFHVFDLAPEGQVTLLASPGFKPDMSSNYFLAYGGMTQSGKKFEGVMEKKRRKTPVDGPLKFQIMINEKDVR